MNKSFSKIRHIQEANLRLEKRMLNEQVKPTAEERYAKAGYKEVTKINLPDGTYIANPDVSVDTNHKENLNYAGDIHIYNNNQRTGYVINFNKPSRSGHKNEEINIRGGNQNTFEGKVYFKDVGYKPNPQQSTTNQGQTKTMTNNVAKEGLKNVTPQMVESPPFDGDLGAYSFGGVFNGVNYVWDCNGVEGMYGVRGIGITGKIISDKNETLSQLTKEEITDAQKGGNFIGFYGSSNKFVIYTTTLNKPKCVNF